LVESWTNIEPPNLIAGLSSLRVFGYQPDWSNLLGQKLNPAVEQFREQYHRLIGTQGQVLESAVKLISLAGYLDSRGFDYVFLDWDDTRPVQQIDQMNPWAQGRFAAVETLGNWATRTGQRIPNDGHPSPDAHLSWTRELLIPYLVENNHCRSIGV
jgi:hypothetical protein